MKKCWLCLSSFIIIYLFSCNFSDKINIEWIVLCDISSLDFIKTPIEIGFINDKGKEKIFKLTPNKTREINLPMGMVLYSIAQMGVVVYIYPDNYANFIDGNKDEERFRKYGIMEIFLYNPYPVEKTEKSLTLLQHEKILLYYYSMFKDGIVYRFFSKNNYINIDTDKIEEIIVDEENYIDNILEIMRINKLSICYDSKSSYPFQSDSFSNYTGFFVHSNLSNNRIILLPSFGGN